MKKIIKEFQEFINRGSVIDMSVGIIVGGAFTNIVKSLVEDIINPFLGLFGGMNFDELKFALNNNITLNYGKFLTAVINFLIMALIVFFMVKIINTIKEKAIKEEVEEQKRLCPYCKGEIALDAIKCPHCTSDLKKEFDALKCEE